MAKPTGWPRRIPYLPWSEVDQLILICIARDLSIHWEYMNMVALRGSLLRRRQQMSNNLTAEVPLEYGNNGI